MSKKATKKTTQVSIDRVCRTCAFHDPATGYCKRKNEPTPSLRYACDLFMTPDEWRAECEVRRQERLRQEEHRLNFLLTALYIQSTATMQMLEYFDAQFQDKKAEADWRFSRKRAANEIDRAVKKIRDLYQHNFMVDQTQVMTNHGKEAFDARAYDSHEDDARRWNKLLLHHMESSWQDDTKEAQILSFYESLPHVGIFEQKDFRHFTTKQ
jgi:hypothetical protein